MRAFTRLWATVGKVMIAAGGILLLFAYASAWFAYSDHGVMVRPDGPALSGAYGYPEVVLVPVVGLLVLLVPFFAHEVRSAGVNDLGRPHKFLIGLVMGGLSLAVPAEVGYRLNTYLETTLNVPFWDLASHGFYASLTGGALIITGLLLTYVTLRLEERSSPTPVQTPLPASGPQQPQPGWVTVPTTPQQTYPADLQATPQQTYPADQAQYNVYAPPPGGQYQQAPPKKGLGKRLKFWKRG